MAGYPDKAKFAILSSSKMLFAILMALVGFKGASQPTKNRYHKDNMILVVISTVDRLQDD